MVLEEEKDDRYDVCAQTTHDNILGIWHTDVIGFPSQRKGIWSSTTDTTMERIGWVRNTIITGEYVRNMSE